MTWLSRLKNLRRPAAAHHKAGLTGEWHALWFYLWRGYWPLAWRYKTPVGEIDLIVRKNNELVFVEVKNHATFDSGIAAVSPRQQQRMRRAAQWFMQAPRFAAFTPRLDVFILHRDKNQKRQRTHLPHAFF